MGEIPDAGPADDVPMKHYITRAAAAALLCVSRRTLDRWREAGVAPAHVYRYGRLWFHRPSVERLAAQRLTGARKAIFVPRDES